MHEIIQFDKGYAIRCLEKIVKGSEDSSNCPGVNIFKGNPSVDKLNNPS